MISIWVFRTGLSQVTEVPSVLVPVKVTMQASSVAKYLGLTQQPMIQSERRSNESHEETLVNSAVAEPKLVGRTSALDWLCGAKGMLVPLRATSQEGWNASQLYVEGAAMTDWVVVSRSSKLTVYPFRTPAFGVQEA